MCVPEEYNKTATDMKEKSQFEKNAADKQVELLSGALSGAVSAGGHWLNATGKGYPKFYPAGVAVSPFNALFMALHSDKHGCKSNLFTLYSEAKARGESVKEHEKGVPFLFYNWNKYVNRNNPNEVISRDDYQKLSPEEKNRYKGVHNREIRTLFNIDQTLLTGKHTMTHWQNTATVSSKDSEKRNCVSSGRNSMPSYSLFREIWYRFARMAAVWRIMTARKTRHIFHGKRISHITPITRRKPFGKS